MRGGSDADGEEGMRGGSAATSSELEVDAIIDINGFPENVSRNTAT